MAEFMLSPDFLYNESEFNAGSGACGPTIVAGGVRWSKRAKAPSASEAMHQMISWGLCSATGVSTLSNLYKAALRYGVPTQLNKNPTTGPLTFCMQSQAGTNGRRPGVNVVFLAYGQAIVDYLSRQGQDATNLHGHFIGIIGYNTGGFSNYLGCSVPEGFFAIDGDNGLMNPVVPGVGRIHRFINTQLGYYTLPVVQAAQPRDVFSITR